MAAFQTPAYGVSSSCDFVWNILENALRNKSVNKWMFCELFKASFREKCENTEPQLGRGSTVYNIGIFLR